MGYVTWGQDSFKADRENLNWGFFLLLLLLIWKYFFFSFTEVLMEYIDSHYLLLTNYRFLEVKMSKAL